MTDRRELALAARSWPFEEARKLLARVEQAPSKGEVVLETGSGPSGLPHIGTFAEVVRTTMVRHAFAQLSDLPTRLIAFSDDLDGLRKVPDNIPNRELVGAHLGKPLTAIPDPFGTHPSFGHHNNARLRVFLDGFGFEYTFLSATDCYRSGRFDAVLLDVLRHYDEILEVILPTLGPDRRATYSPFLPISPDSGRVIQEGVLDHDAARGTVLYRDEDGTERETSVTGGACKLQWKVDWAGRWTALGVDYEMAGKDLIESVNLSSRICAVLGARPPEGFNYELFHDERGEKISKSRGNGLSVEEWLAYAPPESLSLFMFNSPRKAKRLHFDVIPKTVDDYLAWLTKYPEQEPAAQLDNPVWHIHEGHPPRPERRLDFALLLNLASVCNAEDRAVLWAFISRYAPDATPESAPILDRLVGHALRYYQDIVKPTRRYRPPSELERTALRDLVATLERLPADADAEAMQFEAFEVGNRHPFENLREWFRALYEILLGQSQGPRFGSFVALYGRAETMALIRRVLTGESLA
jgi:lysyl-tRNA synthetase class 1